MRAEASRHGCRLDGRCVYFQHIGRVKVKVHRPIEGRIKTISLKLEADGWYVVCSCDLGDVNVSEASGPAVGIDLGLKAFLVTSEGESIAPPQYCRTWCGSDRAVRTERAPMGGACPENLSA
ncbi:MAG: transposase [Blastochloris sp.]|nr:transposase [Blastochloris sp.]